VRPGGDEISTNLPIDHDTAGGVRWKALQKEVERLRRLHGDALCDAEKCRDFNRKMSDLLMKLEEMEEFRLADRVMDALSVCNPKTGSHCDNSERMKGILERLNERVKEKLKENQNEPRRWMEPEGS
jgi:hypothetical protein